MHILKSEMEEMKNYDWFLTKQAKAAERRYSSERSIEQCECHSRATNYQMSLLSLSLVHWKFVLSLISSVFKFIVSKEQTKKKKMCQNYSSEYKDWCILCKCLSSGGCVALMDIRHFNCDFTY